ncbi:hypothetical protein ELI54_31270 (plasmid) [Rhizobium ruizarguesonis]|jgi:hypothetical protein|uniref:hypothetical protein n=1 Tax=Rhizobium ruizarguesonis TaxID=2081791 RepID=UPI0010302FAC|nr:hypothetical protein [Rhizobium ruizarguesonis]TAT70100.1 hypothetical protein ELI56_37720 [Rhizobium ruizarguesonis]TAT75227.1 hypothetical protein ELI54_31270 [Rhizobium ruizarguesonis]TAY63948.1 hypothetical protein ELH86_35955 [Rhizobium ruizarguesonis]TAZ23043.1 hypothetical protein ELH80_35660 [Rhizobium ruizarguesonis]TAZ66784.1 hypothetical protein ELH70_31685 [Rhizobium ruizarguesonis]
MDIRIFVEGHVDDLYALSLLFPEGAYPGLHVVTGIKGEKQRPFDHVTDASDRKTYVTGEGCLPLLATRRNDEAGWVAREILAPLNGYAVLAESNFQPVIPVSAEYRHENGGGGMTFGESVSSKPRRGITVGRHPNLAAMRNSRVELMTSKPLAAYAASVIAGQPNWADYYRLLEDIAGERGTTLDKLTDVGLAKRPALNAFKAAANNRAFGRHGASKRDTTIDQSTLMNLLEAREFVRGVVTKWLDAQCGDVMPTDRVDGGPLRFGLDDDDDDE